MVTPKQSGSSEPTAEMPAHDPQRFAEHMGEAMQLWAQILQRLGQQHGSMEGFGHTDPMHIYETFLTGGLRSLQNPQALWQENMHMWRDYQSLWLNTQERLIGKETSAYIPNEGQDKRFKDDAWQESLWFDHIRQQYLLASRWMERTTNNISGLDKHTHHKLSFFSRQLMDALSPTNYMFTNPEVMRETLASDGENIVRGLRNLLQDLERSNGRLRITMTDENAFKLGENIACTPGKVVFQNDLMQLIQYTPTTPKVHKTPLLLIPAWINKYYIFDLQPKNSFVKWLVAQGYTVFMVSWVNPDEELGRKSFEDYMLLGPLAALDAIEKATGEKEINAIGYCLGGTLLAITLAYLQENGHPERIRSATYLTTMVDFSDAGDLSVFIDEGQLQTLEERMSENGYLEGQDMAVTFNMLRANDLIWSFVVNNYMLGRDPFPFDLLYWNADSTRMPATMHSFYLRNMYQKNRLVCPGGIVLDNTPIKLNKIKTPSYLLGTEQDHIAPWQATYAATQVYDGPITFTLAESGHVAGVISHPDKVKYGYWSHDTLPHTHTQWREKAEYSKDSWWLHWHRWMKSYNGTKVAARDPAKGPLTVIEDAPGSYVRARSEHKAH